METTRHLTQEQIRGFQEDGYLVVDGLFGRKEVRALVESFMRMHAGGQDKR